MNEVTVNNLTFKALSVETRVKILKLLLKSKLTQTDLAESLGLTIPSVKEHLDFLVNSGLIERLEEGRKWKYYQVTNKTKSLFNSEYYKFVITLGVFVISAGLSIIISLQKSATFIMEKSEGIIGGQIEETIPGQATDEPSMILFLFFMIIVISLIFTIIFWIKYRQSPYKLIKRIP